MIFQEWYQIPEKVQPPAEPQEKQTGGLLYRDWWLCNSKFSQVKEIGNFSWKIKVKAVSEWLSHGWRNLTYLTTKKTIGSGIFWECAKGPNESTERPEEGQGRRQAGQRCSEEAQRVEGLRHKRSFPSIRTFPQVSWVLRLVLGPEDTKMLNSSSPHIRGIQSTRSNITKRPKGMGQKKVIGLRPPETCESVAQWEGWKGTHPQEAKMWVVNKGGVLWLFMVFTESRFIPESRLEGWFRRQSKKLKEVEGYEAI